MTIFQFYLCFKGIVFRESLRFFYQRERFFSALVRPLVWLAIFAVGFRSILGVSRPLGQPENWPYPISLIPYELYIAAGLIAMIQLFNGMQSSLSMVYDREMGSMRTLLVSPFPRFFLLISKLVAGVSVSIIQVFAFLMIALFWDIELPMIGYLTVIPALFLSGMMLGAGETEEEIATSIRDLADVGCSILTLGQYLSPSAQHVQVERFVHPDEFIQWREFAIELGFRHVESGPLVRSSYHAAEQVDQAVAADPLLSIETVP